MTDSAVQRQEALEYAKLLEEKERREKFRKLDFYRPYTKQALFHAYGASKHERALIAANRSGKTYSAGAEVAMHLTGIYPPWWVGRKFDKPTRWWAAGTTGQNARDTAQRILFGTPNVVADRGTGMVPKSCVNWEGAEKGISTAHGYQGLYDTVQVKHVSGGVSTIRFMTYKQQREDWQAETLEGVWCDEEPPIELYSEGLTRLATTGGLMLCTFTPLEGMSDVVTRYLSEPSEDRVAVNMTLDEAEHIAPEERTRIVEGYLEHEREARAKGVPLLGSGKIFAVSEAQITEPAIRTVPPFWHFGIGMDYGIDHPFGAVLGALDREADCLHILDTRKMKGATALEHAAALKPWGNIYVFWPHDVAKRDGAGTGETYAQIYKKHGLRMYPKHAHWRDGGISTEAAVLECQERFRTGRLKIASHLEELLAEIRIYHRKDGQIVKLKDDLISALFKLVMMLRYCQARASGDNLGFGANDNKTRMAKDVEFSWDWLNAA